MVDFNPGIDMCDEDFKKYILEQLENIRDALLDDEDHKEAVCFNLGVLMDTIELNIHDEDCA